MRHPLADDGVVGFDIAGPEAGYPPTRHLDAFDLVRRENFHITIHAGESFGLPSIGRRSSSLARSGSGHGVRSSTTSRSVTTGRRARPAGRVRPGPPGAPRDVPDVQRAYGRRGVDRRASHRPAPTAAVPRHGQHGQPPYERRHPLLEFAALDAAFGLGLGEMEWLTINASARPSCRSTSASGSSTRSSSPATPICVRNRPASSSRSDRGRAVGSALVAGPEAHPESHPRRHEAHPQDRPRLRAQ